VAEPAELTLAAGAGAGANSLRARSRAWLWILGAVAFLLGSLLAGAFVGPVRLGPGAIVEAVASRIPLLGIDSPLSPTEEAILFQIRLPRVVLGCLVGAMLASAGASYQGVFRNPLADPYLLGVAAGAGLGATVAVAYGPPGAASAGVLPLAAFVGGAGAVAAAYVLGRSAGGRSPTALILAGVVVASFLTALQTFVQQQNLDTIQEVYSWILGRLSTSGWRDVAVITPYVAVSATGLLLHRRLLDVLAVGDEEARSLGVNVRRVRLIVVAAATLGTAAAVAVSGLIGFVGIVVPHAIRLLAGTSYRILLPLSLLCGAGFLVLADVLARTALSPAELPIGVVTAFFGAPFFAVVLRTSRTVGP
jgi:iron complex transport system permease protein